MTEGRDRARERLVRVAVAENTITAEMIRETLAQAGIRSMLKNRDGAAVVFGGGLAGSWSLEVWVLEGDADAAAVLLGGPPPPPALSPPAVPEAPAKRRWWSRLFRGTE